MAQTQFPPFPPKEKVLIKVMKEKVVTWSGQTLQLTQITQQPSLILSHGVSYAICYKEKITRCTRI